MMLEALGEYCLNPVSYLRDENRVGRVSGRCLKRVAHLDYAPVDDLHVEDEQAKQGDDCEYHDEADNESRDPEGVLVRRHGRDEMGQFHCSASQPVAAALQSADDDGRVLDGRAQGGEWRRVVYGVLQTGVDLRRFVADRAREQQDRNDEHHHRQHDDAADREAEYPAEVAGGPGDCHEVCTRHDPLLLFRLAQTVSQKSRTGFRLALTEVSRSGTVLVSCATACTPPVVADRFARLARRWKITRSKATAVIAMMRAAMISVTQAAAGMTVLLSANDKLGCGALG